jgi:hypothetical protein
MDPDHATADDTFAFTPAAAADEAGARESAVPGAGIGATAIVALTTFVLVCYPSCYALLRGGVLASFNFIKGDSFLYLTIARNSSFGHFSFDGTTITNGFHPLWQYALTFLFSGQGVDQMARQMVLTTSLSVLCTALGITATNIAVYRLTQSKLLALLTIPGVYYLLAGSFFDNNAVWDNVSGMEAGLSVLCGGVLLLTMAGRLAAGDEPTLDQLVDEKGLSGVWLRMGLVLPFVVMTRLDDVFVAFCLGAVPFFFSSRPLRDRIIASFSVMVPTGIVLVAYMAHNKLTAGTFLPVSGMVKSGVVLPASVFISASGLFPPLVDLKNALVSKQSDPWVLYLNMFRVVEMLFPAFFSLVFLYVARTWQRAPKQLLFGALAVYVMVKAGYNLANVNLWHQGPWYFAFPILLVSFFGALMVAPAYRAIATTQTARFALTAVLGCLILMTSARNAMAAAYDTARTIDYKYFENRQLTEQALTSQIKDPKLIAFDDGITGYALRFSTIHGFCFAADLETARALREQRLLEHVYGRGHQVITSADYMAMDDVPKTSDEVRAWLEASFLEPNVKAELGKFDYRVVYVEPATKSPFIEFWPKGTR